MSNRNINKLVLDNFYLIENFFSSRGFEVKNTIKKEDGVDKLFIIIFNSLTDLSINISFCRLDTFGIDINLFEVNLIKTNATVARRIDLDKFVQKNKEIGNPVMFSLNYYSGTLEEKVKSCLLFLYKVFNHPLLEKVYSGFSFPNKYQKVLIPNQILFDLIRSNSGIFHEFADKFDFQVETNVILKREFNLELLEFLCKKTDEKVIIRIIFCGIDGFRFENNSFGIFIRQPHIKDSLGINLDKFVQKHPDLGSIEMLSLNYYTGTIEEKINNCLQFIVKVLSHPELLRVYEGNYYTNEYYRHLYEIVNR